jgi:hypothetical protein
LPADACDLPAEVFAELAFLLAALKRRQRVMVVFQVVLDLGVTHAQLDGLPDFFIEGAGVRGLVSRALAAAVDGVLRCATTWRRVNTSRPALKFSISRKKASGAARHSMG